MQSSEGRGFELNRTVAIKVLSGHISSNTESRQRFEREAQPIADLKHPNICVLYDVGQQDGVDFLIMEFIEGETLANRLTRGPLPLDQALKVAIEALGVLGAMGAMRSITGIFGMAAYSVSKRLRELGIRIALGAQRREVLQAALGRALRLLALGSAAGLLLGMLATRVLASIVYQASPRDPLVLAGVVFIMFVLGLAATWIPARPALSIDPLSLLREE